MHTTSAAFCLALNELDGWLSSFCSRAGMTAARRRLARQQLRARRRRTALAQPVTHPANADSTSVADTELPQ
jgi:hypothetical protein